MYICHRCGYKNKLKSNFKRHLNRKYQCKPILDDISCEEIYIKYFSKNEQAKTSQRQAKTSQKQAKTSQKC